MCRRDFQRPVDSLQTLSPHQLRQLNETVSVLAQRDELRSLVAEQVAQDGRSPHYFSEKFQRWGHGSR